MTDLTQAVAVMERLEAIEADLEVRQNALESAAMNWYRAKRDKEHARAVAFLSADGTVAVRSAILETRATIGMAILKAQGRA